MTSNRKTARIAGVLYLAHFIAFCLADIGVHSSPVGSVDLEVVTRNIVASKTLFSLGSVAFLVAALFFLVAAWALYVLLRPVEENVALGFLLLNLVGVTVWCTSQAGEFLAIALLGGGDRLISLRGADPAGAAMLFLSTYQRGFMIAQIFLGLWLFPLGYLVVKSGFLPRVLGILLIVDGFAMLTWFVQFMVRPDLEVVGTVCLSVGLLAEGLFCLWLVIRGISEPKRSVTATA